MVLPAAPAPYQVLLLLLVLLPRLCVLRVLPLLRAGLVVTPPPPGHG
jgi:hypothetical protein